MGSPAVAALSEGLDAITTYGPHEVQHAESAWLFIYSRATVP